MAASKTCQQYAICVLWLSGNTYKYLRKTNLYAGLFNQELLLAIFVFRVGPPLPNYDRMTENEPYFSERMQPFLSAQEFIKRDPKHHFRSQRFQRLVTSWWLQGLILRPHSDDSESSAWINAVQSAAKCLDEWMDFQSPTISKASIMSMTSSTLGSVEGSLHLSKTIELACDAIVCLFGPQDLSKKMFDPPTKRKSAKWTFSFVLHLICCLVGDIPAIEDSIHLLPPETLKKEVYVLLCGLVVAARQGNTDAVQYLLEVDTIRPNWGYACSSGIVPAVESGNVAMLELFLGPKYGMYLCGSQLERASIVAAEFPDNNTRLDLVSRLLSDAVHDKLRLRHLVLATACKINDLPLAELTVTGWSPLTMAYENYGLLHPLESACHYRRVEILRLLFNATNQNRGESYRSAVDKWFFWAISMNYDELFVEFLPHMKWIDPHQIMMRAARVDLALSALENLLGPSDCIAKLQDSFQDSTYGEHMLYTALEHHKFTNVKWLLSRGIQTSQPISIPQDECVEHPTALQDIAQLLRRYEDLGFDI